MTDSDWIKKAILLWICVTNSFYRGTHARHYEKCLTPDGHQGVCVVKRYCREATNVSLIPCDGDDSFCCPIPTAPLSEQPFRTEANPPPTSESLGTSLDVNIRPSSYPIVGENRTVDKDGRLRAPASSFNRHTDRSSTSTNYSQTHKNNPVVYDYFPVGPVGIGLKHTDTPLAQIPTVHGKPLPDVNRNFPITSSHKPRVPDDLPFEDIHRPLQIHRPKNSRPDEGFEDEELRRPITSSHKPRAPDDHVFEDIHRPLQNHRPKKPRPDDGYEDEELPRTITTSHKPRVPDDLPFEDIPRTLQIHRPKNSRPDDGYEDEELPRTITTSHKPRVPDDHLFEDIHRPLQNHRPKKPRPDDGYEDEELRRPTSNGPQSRPQTNAHHIQRETLANRNSSSFIGPSSTGKVRFEDEATVSDGHRQLPKHDSQRPTVDGQRDHNSKNREHSTTKPRHEIPPSRKEILEHVHEEAPRGVRGRPPSRMPSHYPSKDRIEFHESPKPVGNSDASKVLAENTANKDVPIKFPDRHELQVSQPKVPACGVKPYELFIAGGETSKANEWPWMTAIFRRHQSSRPKTFLCGGSLINTKYILTAAHCFVNNYVILPASAFVVKLGSHQLSSGEEYTVSNLVIHHNHSGSDFFNDIALVRLASEVYVTDKIAPICLPFAGLMNVNLVGRIATVSGWGDTAFRTGAARELQHVAVPIVSGEECFAAYSRVRGAAFLARGSDHVICAGLREGGKDACLGDSGGPLMLKSPDDSWVIVGIVSLGYKCAEPGYPGVYTRVTHYMEWIQTNMKSY